MGTRRQARELAMQALFYLDMRNNASVEMLERFCGNFSPSKKSRPFFLKLVNGVLESKDELDALIERFSKNWDIPPKVSINEAVDVGKKFGTEESGSFINGIMDSIRLELEEAGKLKKGDKIE
jgi:N utilization substance protein B